MRVRGDFARLAQVLANLLNNAAKYTDDGGRISLAATARASEIVFRVRDSGMGIPKEALASIFEPFRQLGQAVDRPQGGLGVGLTLVKRLVDKHGGAVEVRSDGRCDGQRVRRPPAAPRRRDRPARRRKSTSRTCPMRRLRAGDGGFSSPTTTSISRRAWDFCSS